MEVTHLQNDVSGLRVDELMMIFGKKRGKNRNNQKKVEATVTSLKHLVRRLSNN